MRSRTSTRHYHSPLCRPHNRTNPHLTYQAPCPLHSIDILHIHLHHRRWGRSRPHHLLRHPHPLDHGLRYPSRQRPHINNVLTAINPIELQGLVATVLANSTVQYIQTCWQSKAEAPISSRGGYSCLFIVPSSFQTHNKWVFALPIYLKAIKILKEIFRSKMEVRRKTIHLNTLCVYMYTFIQNTVHLNIYIYVCV